MELGGKFWLGLVGIIFAVGIGLFVVFAIIGAAWYAWGGVGAILFCGALILGAGYIWDRAHRKSYSD